MSGRRMHIVRSALRYPARYPLRSGLLVLSAGLGVAGVVCSVNYGAGGSEQLLNQIRRMGTRVLIVSAAQSRAVAGRARTGGQVTTLVESDYRAIRNAIPARVRSSAQVTGNFWVKEGDLSKNAVVVGCEPDWFAIKNWRTKTGRVFDAAEDRGLGRVALLGHTAAVELFGDAAPEGRRILINRVPFTVIGVLAERGQGLDVSNEDSQIYVPLGTAMRRLMNVDYYGGIVLEMDSVEDMTPAEEEMRSLLRRRHHLGANRADDFLIQNQESLLETQAAASERLRFLLMWIGGSTLAVSDLGILGITWIAVRERTREMGTRRALGATAGDILLQIVAEGGVLAAAGGVAGLGAAWPMTRAINAAARFPVVFAWWPAAAALAAGCALNVVFSLLPARAAARMDPAEALRFE